MASVISAWGGSRHVGGFSAANTVYNMREMASFHEEKPANTSRGSPLVEVKSNGSPHPEGFRDLQKEADGKKQVDHSMQTRACYKNVTRYSDVSFYLGFLGVCLMVTESEVCWRSRGSYIHGSTVFWAANAIRALSSFVTIALLFCQHEFYANHVKLLKLRYQVPESTPMLLSPLKFKYLLALAVNSIHSPPFIDWGTQSYYSLADTIATLNSLMFLRVYLVLGFLRNRSPLNTSNGRFIGALTNVEYNAFFLLKTYLEANPFYSLMAVIVLVLLVCSYVAHLFERTVSASDYPELRGRNETFSNSIWMLIITMLTVGYGDVFPVTIPGRVCSVICGCAGLMFSATLIGVLQEVIAVTHQEFKVISFLDHHETYFEVRGAAVNCVIRAWALFKARKAAASKRKLQALEDSMYTAIRFWRKIRREKSGILDGVQTDLIETVQVTARKQEELLHLVEEHAPSRKSRRSSLRKATRQGTTIMTKTGVEISALPLGVLGGDPKVEDSSSVKTDQPVTKVSGTPDAGRLHRPSILLTPADSTAITIVKASEGGQPTSARSVPNSSRDSHPKSSKHHHHPHSHQPRPSHDRPDEGHHVNQERRLSLALLDMNASELENFLYGHEKESSGSTTTQPSGLHSASSHDISANLHSTRHARLEDITRGIDTLSSLLQAHVQQTNQRLGALEALISSRVSSVQSISSPDNAAGSTSAFHTFLS
eukprot:GILI01004751.1.p1 GENE.GILI01004751.1~~GILI01004751.1.p1  ORF type:complete len:712 (+),score=118.98 GILI01004751.1:102-2237(+)